MEQDFVNIRKGTSYKTALKNSVEIISKYILNESRNLKTERGIHINIQADRTKD